MAKIMYFDWAQKSVINAYGDGYISVNKSQGKGNGLMLNFDAIPYTFYAYLPNGGQLYIQAGDTNINMIT